MKNDTLQPKNTTPNNQDSQIPKREEMLKEFLALVDDMPPERQRIMLQIVKLMNLPEK